MKLRNIVKWYKAYVAHLDKTTQEVTRDIPYTVVMFKEHIVYGGRKSWSSPERCRAINQWLRANVNRDRFVYLIQVEINSVMTAKYDNALWNFGQIAGVAFQHEADAVLFKLANIDHIT